MTEEQLQGLGFEITERYGHDHYHTHRYTKGVLEVEFTYDGENLETCELTIQEVNSMPVNIEEITTLAKIFEKLQ